MNHPTVIKIVPADAEEPTAEYARRLRELSEAMDRRHLFRPGQIVRWKPGLRNRRAPDYNEPAIVRAVLTEPVADEGQFGRDSGSPGFREPLTLVLGFLVDDGDFLEFYYDGRQFEPVVK